MEKLKNKLNGTQNIFVDLKDKTASEVFDILEGKKVFIDLKEIKTEREFLNKIYLEIIKIEKINKIFKEYNIKQDDFELYNLIDLEDELLIGELKIVFSNINSVFKEIQEIINSLVSYRQRKIVYIIIGNFEDYYFFTGLEGINIREGDDYIVIN